MLNRNLTPREEKRNNKKPSRLERPLSYYAKQSLLHECFSSSNDDNLDDLNGDYEPDIKSTFGVE